jgi:predicted DNA-binding protein
MATLDKQTISPAGGIVTGKEINMTKSIQCHIRMTEQTKRELDALVENSVSPTTSEYVRQLIHKEYEKMEIDQTINKLQESEHSLHNTNFDISSSKYDDLLKRVYGLFIKLARKRIEQIDLSIFNDNSCWLDVITGELQTTRPKPMLNTRFIKLYDGKTNKNVYEDEISFLEKWYRQ